MFVLWYHYGNKVTTYFKGKRERVLLKYKKRWLSKYNPHHIQYSTPQDTFYKCENIKEKNRLILEKAFLNIEK
jgi:hypothetical protein